MGVPFVFVVGGTHFRVAVPLPVPVPVPAATTLIAKAGRDAVALPLLTVIKIFEETPTLGGVPESCPVAILKVAHEGLF
jgi:hypothetical protein